ncbi:winged helix DNA-binding domain-containing protein [Planococcus sp. YIM B11945]|uniref:winged helix DNA-binding domain-containing protein n=1 Tax=Planococcus sp. YIM B11945 TaxID=3435410 RepID=UPI003D7C7C62
MDSIEIGRKRLARQRIEGAKFERAEQVVEWMGAMQAQAFPQALWAVAKRMQNGTQEDVEQALSEGKIVRTWPMRGTLHFVAPEDAKWLLRLSAPRVIASSKGRLKQLELDIELLDRCIGLFHQELAGGKHLSRAAMMDVLEQNGVLTANQRGYHILWHAAQTGQICLGPVQAKQQTFVLLDEWVPNARNLTREESLHELAMRYFHSHGPATVHDFAWWMGSTVKDAKMALAFAKSNLALDTFAGTEYWSGADSGGFSGDAPSFHLLPAFDEFLLGYKDRSAVLPEKHTQQVVPGKNGIFLPFVAENGQVVGTWKKSVGKKKVELAVSPFSLRSNLVENLKKEAEAIGRFHQLPVAISFQ